MRTGLHLRSHFIESHVDAGLGDLPGSLAPRQAPTDDPHAVVSHGRILAPSRWHASCNWIAWSGRFRYTTARGATHAAGSGPVPPPSDDRPPRPDDEPAGSVEPGAAGTGSDGDLLQSGAGDAGRSGLPDLPSAAGRQRPRPRPPL